MPGPFSIIRLPASQSMADITKTQSRVERRGEERRGGERRGRRMRRDQEEMRKRRGEEEEEMRGEERGRGEGGG